jgi:hypothetical protein
MVSLLSSFLLNSRELVPYLICYWILLFSFQNIIDVQVGFLLFASVLSI